MATWLRGFWALGTAVAGRGGGRLGLIGGGPSIGPCLQPRRSYARPVGKKKTPVTSHLDDLPPTTLKKAYNNLPIMDKVDDVVKKLLSLEMASQREKVKIKKEQLADLVRNSPNDNGSLEVQVAHVTARIRTLQEHVQMLPKDKVNKRHLLMAIDRRNQLLKYLRRSRYDAFEKTCKALDIEYVLPPQYRQRRTRRYLVKRALRQKIFEELRKQKLENDPQKQEGQEGLPAEGTPV